MKLLELKTLICAECGTVMRPGGIEDCCVRYTHPPELGCSHSEQLCLVDLRETAIHAKVVGRWDYSTLPGKIGAVAEAEKEL